MSLPPPKFSGSPGEDQYKYFRNVCIEFKKAIKTSNDVEKLQFEMQRFLDASKDVQWPHNKSDVFHKNEVDKAIQKVWSEFKRYEKALEASQNVSAQDLLDALAIVESLTERLKVR